MIEGGGSKTLSKAKKWLYTRPEASIKLLQLLTDVNVDYLVGQVKAGAQMLQVFESHAEYLNMDLFSKFCLPFLTQICSRVKTKLKECGIEPVPMVCTPWTAKYYYVAGMSLSFQIRVGKQ